MSAQVIPFIYQDQPVRVVMKDGEPWFVGKDVCGVLGIRDYRQALESLDVDERGGCIVPTPGGDQEMIVISEAGVWRLVFQSRKPQAEALKRWLAHEVLPSIRRTGVYAVAPPAPPVAAPSGALALDTASLTARISAVRAAAHLFGRQRAAQLWQELGLPEVPPASRTFGTGQSDHVLDRLLRAMVEVDGSLTTLGAWLEEAAGGDVEVRRQLERGWGLRWMTEPSRRGIFIANSSRLVRMVFPDMRPYEAHQALRRLPGVRTGERYLINGRQERGTLVPERLLDEGRQPPSPEPAARAELAEAGH